ncbi:glutamate-rich protein 2 isoform X2 [Ictalurus punctatus]|uniref:Glutamate-rich protein 2 isoform X2 n=1 Tax=Ictalurus punctatus TaxID=7998 RepID=A0A2D0RXF6_ICTPU|nr:glutamate-rich protein 2 isoform X2 [Ictalurus punctatus]
MSSLQCVGTSSKVPAKDLEAVKPGVLISRDAPVNKSVQSKTQRQKPKASTWPDGQQIRSSAITERRRDNGNVDRITEAPEPVSETPSAQLEKSFKKTKIKHGPSRSETHVGLQAPSPVDTTTHRQEKSPRHTAPAGAEEKTVSAECAQKMCEAVVQVPRYLGVPKHGTGRSTSEAESRGEEECEEEDEDADEFRAPIELLAEFLKAVMERNYTLCKKLCQMILIYEPENPEAKHFLPLIEERLLIEEAQEGSTSEDNTYDDDDDEDDDESSSGSTDDDDDDDDDDDTDTSTDSDGENSCSSSSDREEEDISQQ